MKTLFALLILSVAALAQTAAPPTNIYAAGVSYNDFGSPKLAGTALYARLVDASAGTYMFTVYDVLPTKTSPLTVTNNVGGGVAQKLFTLGKVPIYAPISADFSFNGQNTGWAWSGGAMADVKIKGNWRALPNVRLIKSSVNNNSGYQFIVGVLASWGK